MAIREITTIPEPILRRKARKVTDFGHELQIIIDDMVDCHRLNLMSVKRKTVIITTKLRPFRRIR